MTIITYTPTDKRSLVSSAGVRCGFGRRVAFTVFEMVCLVRGCVLLASRCSKEITGQALLFFDKDGGKLYSGA